MKKRAYIGLGSNMGDKNNNLTNACDHISALEGVDITDQSSLYLTAPWGNIQQPDFINQVIAIETDLTAMDLLYALQKIEIKLGRQRFEHWGPRSIDLDILLYGEDVINLEELKVPHPYLFDRLFVLVPLEEIAPALVFPDGTRIGEVLGSVVARNGKHSIQKRIIEESRADTPE